MKVRHFFSLLLFISVLDNIYFSRFFRLINLSRQAQDSESLLSSYIESIYDFNTIVCTLSPYFISIILYITSIFATTTFSLISSSLEKLFSSIPSLLELITKKLQLQLLWLEKNIIIQIPHYTFFTTNSCALLFIQVRS